MMPPTAPMSDAPPPPLPVNPRMSQPSPKNSFQAQQEANLLGLQEAKYALFFGAMAKVSFASPGRLDWLDRADNGTLTQITSARRRS